MSIEKEDFDKIKEYINLTIQEQQEDTDNKIDISIEAIKEKLNAKDKKYIELINNQTEQIKKLNENLNITVKENEKLIKELNNNTSNQTIQAIQTPISKATKNNHNKIYIGIFILLLISLGSIILSDMEYKKTKQEYKNIKGNIHCMYNNKIQTFNIKNDEQKKGYMENKIFNFQYTYQGSNLECQKQY